MSVGSYGNKYYTRTLRNSVRMNAILHFAEVFSLHTRNTQADLHPTLTRGTIEVSQGATQDCN